MNDFNQTILIVDDEPNVRLVFRTVLESTGYTVEEAAGSEQALDLLERVPVALVLLDLRLIGSISGLETLRQLRNAGNDVPVVIITAHGSIPDAVAAMKLGAIDFLAKPIDPQTLRRVVADVVHRHAPVERGSETEPERADPLPLAQGVGTAVSVMVHAPAGAGLLAVKKALNRREFDRALDLLEETLESDPDSAEAHNLMGVLRETLGQDHAAYQAYKRALTVSPHYGPARDNMRRYCARFGLDPDNPRINPGID
jgi:DNA-binding response OmpR family regulator